MTIVTPRSLLATSCRVDGRCRSSSHAAAFIPASPCFLTNYFSTDRVLILPFAASTVLDWCHPLSVMPPGYTYTYVVFGDYLQPARRDVSRIYRKNVGRKKPHSLRWEKDARCKVLYHQSSLRRVGMQSASNFRSLSASNWRTHLRHTTKETVAFHAFATLRLR